MSYRFRILETGEPIELDITFVELLERQRLNRVTLDDGREAARDFAAEAQAMSAEQAHAVCPAYNNSFWRHHRSVSMGCHPEQIAEFRENAKRAGLTGVDYDDRGRVKFSDRGQRRRFLKLHKVNDLDGGYGD